MSQSPDTICSMILQDNTLYALLNLNDSLLKQKFQNELNNSDDIHLIRDRIESQLAVKNPADYLLICQAMFLIYRFVPPIIFLIGTVGNVLAFTVLCRRSRFYPSTYVYLATLALTDEMVLCFGLLIRWTDRLTGKHLTDAHWILCKSVNFVGVTTSCMSVWIIVTVTVERALVVILPLRSSSHIRLKRSKIVIFCLTLILCLFASHFFVTVDLEPPDHEGVDPAGTLMYENPVMLQSRKNIAAPPEVNMKPKKLAASGTVLSCDFCSTYIMNGFKRAWTWIDATLYSYVPFVIITVFNIIILINIHEADKERASLIGSNRTGLSTKLARPLRRQTPIRDIWRRLFCRKKHRQGQPTIQKRCLSCAQSFPVEQFPSALPIPSVSRSPCTAQMHSQTSGHDIQQSHKWLDVPNERPVNFKFVDRNLNGVELKTSSVSTHSKKVSSNEMRQITPLLLLISGTFLITTAPVVVAKLIIGWANLSDIRTITQIELFDCIAEMLMYMNHAANFYLYMAVGTRFRREIRRMCSCGRGSERGKRRTATVLK
ncbi:unnamed protein product [Calicophoron daubneyi]|uniref:G-protein coupled receptors family 1 profile domain-containing protein n=1 Tax=Calicophoron daubneyi TaxID=300641 RepID=A0AAV2SZH8_CALDB